MDKLDKLREQIKVIESAIENLTEQLQELKGSYNIAEAEVNKK